MAQKHAFTFVFYLDSGHGTVQSYTPLNLTVPVQGKTNLTVLFEVLNYQQEVRNGKLSRLRQKLASRQQYRDSLCSHLILML
jgi:hypothetical protein